VIKKLKRWIL